MIHINPAAVTKIVLTTDPPDDQGWDVQPGTFKVAEGSYADRQAAGLHFQFVSTIGVHITGPIATLAYVITG